jgi:hypothetical protein
LREQRVRSRERFNEKDGEKRGKGARLRNTQSVLKSKEQGTKKRRRFPLFSLPFSLFPPIFFEIV